MSGWYHQDERDLAAGLGAVALLAAVALASAVVALAALPGA